MRKSPNLLIDSQPALLLCEGVDEKYFLQWYITHYLIKLDSNFNKIQIVDFGGIKELKTKLKIISGQENFDKIKRIAVIRDAETNWEAALDSVRDSIISSGIDFDLFSSYSVYLLPGKDDDNWTNGTLEDLCVQLLDNDKCLEISRNYLNSIAENRGCEFKRRHKNLLHAYLSGTDEFVGMKIGEAARANAFNWRSAQLDDLKEFLYKLIEGI